MTSIFICLACGKEKTQSPRSNGRQSYCGLKSCQRARKAHWQRRKVNNDRDYRENQKRCYQAWAKNHQQYWRDYRQSHPEYVLRNLILQRRRNLALRGSEKAPVGSEVFAKMDALKPSNTLKIKNNTEYWLVPVIAKMDALKVRIAVVTETSA